MMKSTGGFSLRRVSRLAGRHVRTLRSNSSSAGAMREPKVDLGMARASLLDPHLCLEAPVDIAFLGSESADDGVHDVAAAIKLL